MSQNVQFRRIVFRTNLLSLLTPQRSPSGFVTLSADIDRDKLVVVVVVVEVVADADDVFFVVVDAS